jgi:hypothetical protein
LGHRTLQLARHIVACQTAALPSRTGRFAGRAVQAPPPPRRGPPHGPPQPARGTSPVVCDPGNDELVDGGLVVDTMRGLVDDPAHLRGTHLQALPPFASPTSQRPQTSAANEPGPLGRRLRAQHVNRRKPPSKKSQAPQTKPSTANKAKHRKQSQAPQTKPSAAPPPDSSNRLSEKAATCVPHTRTNHSSPAPPATRPDAARRRTRAPPHLGYRD